MLKFNQNKSWLFLLITGILATKPTEARNPILLDPNR